MRKSALTGTILILVLLLGFPPIAGSGQQNNYPLRPKLVLIIVIDQFRYDYLVRFQQQFVERGFKLLLKGGANFVDCRYDYATTLTGPGHATLFTGAYGDVHGIIENDWYDRSLHRAVYCVEDAGTKLVGELEGLPSVPGFSPQKLVGSTIGDELRAATNFQSRVIAISVKDRSAVLQGGHTANAAYWYDAKTGRFVTSTYYMPDLPSWVRRFNDQAPAKAYCGRAWDALPETPGGGGKTLKPAGVSTGEACPNPMFLSWIAGTPFMNEIELNFAKAAIRGEHLGRGATTDLLALSLSINDIIGHGFGPYSTEVADTTLRTDRYLAAFFSDLDRLVGLDNVWIALSADHGVAPTPRFIREHDLGMGLFKPSTVKAAIEQALSKAFGKDTWVEWADGTYVYLNHATLSKHGVDQQRAEAVAAEAASLVPDIQAAFTRSQFLTGSLPESPLGRKASHSFYLQRSGDIFLVLSPYAVPTGSETSTTHGSLWSYDAQVPLLLWGGVFKPGVYAGACQPIDLAATLAAVLGLTQPSGTEGKPLVEAIR